MPDGPRKYIFGPVPSRRLGRSLGIDVVPLKTCSYNCLYCQLGATPRTTIERRRWVEPAEVFAELERVPDTAVPIDYATFSGSGEPTLHADLGALIAGVKTRIERPVAVLTNGSLLWDPAVRADLREAHLVCPSLDAGDAATFRRINRPHAGIDFDRMVEGLVTFTREFPGEVWLEVFLIEGVNTTPDELAALKSLVERIRPAQVQLNTAVRPTAESGIEPLSLARLKEIAAFFGEGTEIIPAPRLLLETGRQEASAEAILATLARRPCTAQDLASSLEMKLAEVQKLLETLVARGHVTAARRGDNVYYR